VLRRHSRQIVNRTRSMSACTSYCCSRPPREARRVWRRSRFTYVLSAVVLGAQVEKPESFRHDRAAHRACVLWRPARACLGLSSVEVPGIAIVSHTLIPSMGEALAQNDGDKHARARYAWRGLEARSVAPTIRSLSRCRHACRRTVSATRAVVAAVDGREWLPPLTPSLARARPLGARTTRATNASLSAKQPRISGPPVCFPVEGGFCAHDVHPSDTYLAVQKNCTRFFSAGS